MSTTDVLVHLSLVLEAEGLGEDMISRTLAAVYDALHSDDVVPDPSDPDADDDDPDPDPTPAPLTAESAMRALVARLTDEAR